MATHDQAVVLMSTVPREVGLDRVMPVAGSLSAYRRGWLQGDIAAALTVWAVLVPESMAYAGIAGLPPQTGLYVATVPLLVYALFGTSSRMTVGPTATVAALSAATVAPFAAPGTEEFVAYSVLLSMIVGVVLLIAGVAKLGILSEFLSEPVLKGFLLGTGLIIAIGQIDKVLGVEAEGEGFFGQAIALVRQLPDTSVPSLVLGVVAFVLLTVLHRLVPKIPAALVVVIVSILAVRAFDLESRGIEIVGDIPAGLPSLGIPGVGWDAVVSLLPGALGIAIVVYGESMALAKSFGGRDHRVDANRELGALGLANVAGGLFGGFASGGSSSRTAAASSAGQKTQVSSLMVGALLVLTMLFLTPLFRDLPEPVLGVIVIHAVLGLIKLKPLSQLRARAGNEFTIAVATLAGVLVFDILDGLIIGVFISIVLLMKRAVRPRTTILGRDTATGSFRSVENEGVEPVPGVLVLRFDAELFFANVSVLRDTVLLAVHTGVIRAVVLDAEAVTHVDTTAAAEVSEVLRTLDERQLAFAVARLKTEPLEMLRRCGVDLSHCSYARVAEAVDAVVAEQPDDREQPDHREETPGRP